MIIPYSEIREILKGSYIDDGDEILVRHSVYNGEREFALVLIEKCMGLLNRMPINDKYIIQYLQGLISLTQPETKHYEAYLEAFIPDESMRKKALACKRLSQTDIAVIKELMQTNMAEYTTGNEHSPTIMCHFVRPVEGGCELRTRFWMGYGVINGKPVKLIPDGVEFPLEPVKALLMHNIKEFTHLASILPEVYGEFKDKFTF